MKNISGLSIIVMGVLLAISSSSVCMEKEITHFSDAPKYKNLIRTIEEQLVIREIKRYQLQYVERKLSHGIQQQLFSQPSDKSKKQSIITIKRRCFPSRIKNNSLTQSVDAARELEANACYEHKEAIRRKSSEECYIDQINSWLLQEQNEQKKEKLSRSLEQSLQNIKKLSDEIKYYSPLLNHSLSDNIRCHLIKNQHAVLVTAHLSDADRIQEIIDKYKQENPTNKEPIQTTPNTNDPISLTDEEQTTPMIKKSNNYQNICFTALAVCVISYILATQLMG
jgi:hypothetical protein